MLTVKEVAELSGSSIRTIRRWIIQGKIKAIENENPGNNKKEYLIDPADLPDDLKIKYYNNIGLDASKFEIKANAADNKDNKSSRKQYAIRRLDEYSASERVEISLWIEILEKWQSQRNLYSSVLQADEDIIGAIRLDLKSKGIELNISPQILYRKLHHYRNNELDGLLDNRGAWNKGKSSIPHEVWEGFLYYYLDDRKPALSTVYKNTIDWTKECYPELVDVVPSEASFRRRVNRELPKAVIAYMREGEKVMTDEFITYIERLYDDVEANDVWVADNHTFDIMTRYDDGREGMHRLSLTAFMDAKSGVITGWNITDNPCSNSTLFAIRNGILKHGIPKVVYFDNGSEFLTKDLGGRGIRETKKSKLEERPETILSRLGIEMRTAKIRNGRSKPIERFFLDFKNHISKLFDSYTGGHSQERPESLKFKIKKGMIPTDSELRPLVDSLIELENVAEYGGGEQKRYGGFTKMEVWNDSIKRVKQRIVTNEDDLNLLLMRTTGYQKVKRKGVFINIAGEKIWYSSPSRVWHMDEEVYVRFDPTDLREVRVYDKEDRYMDKWQVDAELMLRFLGEDADKIATANERMAQEKKMVREFAKGLTAGMKPETKIDMLDVMVRKAHAAKEGMYIAQSDIIEPLRVIQEVSKNTLTRTEKKTGTDNIVDIDIARMNANAAKRKGL